MGVIGSTGLAERMDPEDWAATRERAKSVIVGAVEIMKMFGYDV